jgi:hypothetical protein
MSVEAGLSQLECGGRRVFLPIPDAKAHQARESIAVGEEQLGAAAEIQPLGIESLPTRGRWSRAL